MPVEQIVAEILASRKADYVASASLLPALDFVRDQGGDFVAEFVTSISIGIGLPSTIVDLLPRRRERAVQLSYRSHAYDVINQRLDLLASEIGSALQVAGHKAFPIPASERVDDERICASFSHKLAANLAGLGWIGKNCLLITRKHGPRVRWATVLTDAPSGKVAKQLPDLCGNCTKCVEVCPVHAFTGRRFVEGEPRQMRYAAEKCDRYFQEMTSQGDLKVCGMCLYVCPFGMSSNRKNEEVEVL